MTRSPPVPRDVREIVVNACPEETRVVVLEGGKAAEILIERSDDRSLVGNVYLGRVDRVLPGMQSAFVDVGLERHAFLHVADVAHEDSGSGEIEEGEEASADERLGPPIEELLKAGQDVLVQVTRDPLGGKGARVTTHVSLPGKHVVLMPLSENVGISKRIVDEGQREELRRIVEEAHQRVPGGVIARTDAAGRSAAEIEAEMARLHAVWRSILAAREVAAAPACLHREPGIAVRVLRDALAARVARVVVDDERAHAELLAYARAEAPDLVDAIRRHADPTPVLEAMGLESEIEKALRDRVWLKSGGYLVIDQLEALVAIDVNTGKFTGARRLEDTILQTNVEAAREVARQLRLRNLGGIVVVDFIDMQLPENRNQVLRELETAFARDRARTTVLGMSEFGLVEITRQRQKRSLERTLLQACTYCSGSGRIRSTETTVNHILRRVRAEAAGRDLSVRAHPDVAAALRDRERVLRDLGEPLPVRLVIVEEEDRHRDAFEIGSTPAS